MGLWLDVGFEIGMMISITDHCLDIGQLVNEAKLVLRWLDASVKWGEHPWWWWRREGCWERLIGEGETRCIIFWLGLVAFPSVWLVWMSRRYRSARMHKSHWLKWASLWSREERRFGMRDFQEQKALSNQIYHRWVYAGSIDARFLNFIYYNISKFSPTRGRVHHPSRACPTIV